MKSIQFNVSKLLGYRIAFSNGKLGTKDGAKLGEKKIGSKLGEKR